MVPDTEVLTRAGIPSIHNLLQKIQARWAGHVTRMPDDRLPNSSYYAELCYGKRSVGGQKKHFKDTIEKTLTRFNIDVTDWEVCFIPEQEQQKQSGSRRLRKSALLARKSRLYSTTRGQPTIYFAIGDHVNVSWCRSHTNASGVMAT